MTSLRCYGFYMALVAASLSMQAPQGTAPAAAQATPPRPTPPTRDPNTPGYVSAKELPDGQVPPADADGNFIIGPTHNPAPAMATREMDGTVYNFTIESTD